MFKNILLLLGGNLGTSVILLVRMVIVARLISVEDFGISSTFMVFVTILQLMSNLGLNQMIIQDKDGEDPAFQKALQGFQVIRGVIAALFLFLLSWPMARFLGNEDLIWTYQLLALIPLLTGLMHFDVFRMQRRMKFMPLTVTNFLPPLVSLLLLWPLDAVFGDYRVMLYAILAQWVVQLVATHLVAERPYRLSLDWSVMRRGARFGWPLLLNGALLFLVFQGERMIVGREFGMATLAIFSMALSLVQTPTDSVGRAVNQFMLPQLSATKDDDARFTDMMMVTVQSNLLAGIVLSAGIVLLGTPLVTLALGAKYAAVIGLLVPITILESLRSVRACTSQVAMARARTGNGLVGNLPRVLSLPISWLAILDGAGLDTVILIATVGEIAGFGVGLLMMRSRAQVPLRPLIPSLLGFAALMACLVLYAAQEPSPSIPAILVLLAGYGASLLPLGPVWRYLRARKMIAYTTPGDLEI